VVVMPPPAPSLAQLSVDLGCPGVLLRLSLCHLALFFALLFHTPPVAAMLCVFVCPCPHVVATPSEAYEGDAFRRH
jgi:hypothetical protein